ncbi:DUF4209 domain-containing protein [Spirulina sp. CS-785/01]|uniref:DUF4209 domain-containing protein n=1 Tax=Spirulina sp. CS-785/01 TaxID=3021716 RepID=UPI00232E0CBB|nr:DUF4209 domain-containing protein [Spirulina sp. CS-785/01]MDB9314209.1 DUF4209 domain-containing protein [Spirulina sp. CS-785/01]
MSSLTPPLTKDDFLNTDWQDVINDSEQKECFSYWRAFWQKAQEAKEVENTREQAVFEILAAVTNVAIRRDSTEDFFAEHYKNITDEQLDFLSAIVSDISDAELQARVADILWVIRRDYKMAQLAISAYLQSANTLESPDNWTYCFDRIERSLHLARKIKDQDDKVFNHIETVINRYQGEDHLYLSAELMRLLLEYKKGKPTKYIALTEKAVHLAESASNWEKARILWNIKAGWHRIEKEREQELAALRYAAETFFKQAQSTLNQDLPSYITASHFLQRAVQALRNIQGTKEETSAIRARGNEVHKLLLECQQETHKEMGLISVDSNMDISALVEQAQDHVRGKIFHEALFSIALLGTSTNVSKLRQQVEQQAREFILSHISPMVMVNEMGKVIARQPNAILSNDSEEAEEAIIFEMYHCATMFHQKLHGFICIEPARYQIQLEHNVRANDILAIISSSPFIPPNREYLFAKGLYAGLTGDFLTSTHILIPQIENSIRYIMWERGIITSGLDDRGIQNEHNLNTTLYHPEITSIFDDNTLFDLKCLLVEHSGSNLRNRMAHGLISDGEFMNPLMSYIWWLTLRLCCLPIILHQQQVDQSNNSSDPT